MPKLYQFIPLLIVILFFTGCGGTTAVKDEPKKSDIIKPMDSSVFSTMSYEEQIQYAEKLFESALSMAPADKNIQLSNALSLCTQLLTTQDISPELLDYSLQLTGKIMAQMNIDGLSQEQKNQYLLASAAISLSNYQADKTLELLGQNFNSSQTKLWSSYHKLRAMAQFQLGQKTSAIKELIIRHGYLSTEQQRQANQNLIWKYLASLNSYEMVPEESTSTSKGDQIYTGWLKLAKILRDSKDPQTRNHAINFWLQSYPEHQADRQFINQILQARQESVLDIQHIAVLLPLKGKLAKPGLAIRDGILASHYQSPLSRNIGLRFYDTSSNDHIWLTYQQAIDNGADFIIGPLEKNNVAILSEAETLGVPTLALNSLHDTDSKATSEARKTNNLFQFSLSPESEARIVAEKGRLDGHYYAAVMAPDNLWGKRMKTSFTEYWQKSGGVIVDSVDYQSQEHDFSDSIKSMLNIDQSESRRKKVSQTIGRQVEFTPRRRQDIDMMFMAAFPRQAKQIPLQVIYHHGETIPIYSTAHIVGNYHNAKGNIDMDGVVFPDMPFLLGFTHNATSEQNTYQNTLYQRLFAMGVDSYQLSPYVNFLYSNNFESFAGDTGQLTINSAGQIIRSLPWATFEQGNVKPQHTNLSRDNVSLY